jgi:TRAP-type C4-dicarboxylate transport system permease large subunit
VLALLLGSVLFRQLDLRGVFDAFRGAARLTASLFLVFATVQIVNYVLIIGGIQGFTRGLLGVFEGQPVLFLLACMAFFLLVGLVLDAGPALLLLAPLLLPISRQMGIDDMQFSMVMIVSCTMGLITPPVGVCLFVTCRIGNLSMGALWNDLRWFLLAEIGVIVLLVLVPALSTGLPGLFGR